MSFQTTLPKIKTAVPEVDFGYLPELAPYLREPDAMYVGAPGKHGYLRMRFGFNCDGKCVLRELDRRVPIIVQQELYFDANLPKMPCVYILASGGPYIDGDRFEQNIELDPGAYAFVSTGAGTKISTMRSNYAGMKQLFTLHEDSYLEFLPEPVFPGQHSRFACDTEIVCHPSATITYSEIYMCGRRFYRSKLPEGEIYAYDVMSVLTHGRRPDATRDLFREKFVIEPYKRFPKTIGVMADYNIFANVVVLTPPDKAAEVYNATEPFIDRDRQLAAGITTLPNGAGLLYKVMGNKPGPVKEIVRGFASKVRQAVKGVPIPPEFPWR